MLIVMHMTSLVANQALLVGEALASYHELGLLPDHRSGALLPDQFVVEAPLHRGGR